LSVLRVRNEPFFLTGRGLAVVCEPVDGDVRLFLPATVTIPGGPDGPQVEHVDVVEAVLDRSGDQVREWPGLVIRTERDSAHAELLRGLLQPGTLVSLTGPAAAPASRAGEGAPSSRPAS
jgi:hypothetical protein